MIGHPCGPIAQASWLFRHPNASVVVSRFLENDAEMGGSFHNKCSFADELLRMKVRFCKLDRNARRLVSWYERKGCPTPWIV